LENVPFEQKKIKLNSGDLLLLFTDGITEAMNETQAQFEEVRLIKVVEESRNFNSDQIIKKITREVLSFQGLQPQFDDLTLVVIKVQE
jgi:sigma-B regulation protein RsbU (phosphoserine phosphatase)